MTPDDHCLQETHQIAAYLMRGIQCERSAEGHNIFTARVGDGHCALLNMLHVLVAAHVRACMATSAEHRCVLCCALPNA